MSAYALDASGVLAYLWRESGWEVVEQVLLTAPVLISTVNVAEVACKMLERGFLESDGCQLIESLGMEQIDFDSEQAWRTAALRSSTRQWGLSLGDRACLALAQSQGIVALTADRAWLDLQIGIEVESIR